MKSAGENNIVIKNGVPQFSDGSASSDEMPVVVFVDQTDSRDANGDNFFALDSLNTGLGSPTAYAATGATILNLEKFLGLGGRLAPRMGRLGQWISPNARVNASSFGQEMAYHAVFILNIRGIFAAAAKIQEGKSDEIPGALGQAYGVHSLDTLPVGAAALFSYSAVQTGFQHVGVEAADWGLFRGGRLVNLAANVEGRLGPAARWAANGLSGQVESSAARQTWSGFLNPRENLTRGRAASSLLAIGAGSYVGWYAMDLTKASLDSQRLDLYNETPDIIHGNYTDTEFPGVLIGWSIGGTWGFGLGAAVGDAANRAAREHVVPVGVMVFLQQPRGSVTPEVAAKIMQRAMSQLEASGALRAALAGEGSPLAGMQAPGNSPLQRAATLENTVRARYVTAAFSNGEPDNAGRKQWMRYAQPHLTQGLADAQKLFEHSMSQLTEASRELSGGSPESAKEYWDARWSQTQTELEKTAVLQEMEQAEANANKMLAEARKNAARAGTAVQGANSYSAHNYAGGGDTKMLALGDGDVQGGLLELEGDLRAYERQLGEFSVGDADLRPLQSADLEDRFQSRLGRMTQNIQALQALSHVGDADLRPLPLADLLLSSGGKPPPHLLRKAIGQFHEELRGLQADLQSLESVDQVANAVTGTADATHNLELLKVLHESLTQERDRIAAATDGLGKEFADCLERQQKLQSTPSSFTPEGRGPALVALDARLGEIQHIDTLNDNQRSPTALFEQRDGVFRRVEVLAAEDRLHALAGEIQGAETQLAERAGGRAAALSGLQSEWDNLQREKEEVLRRTSADARRLDALLRERDAYQSTKNEQLRWGMQNEAPSIRQIDGKIAALNDRINALQHTENGASVPQRFVNHGQGWRHARIPEIDGRLGQIESGMVKEGLTLESAEVVGREQRSVQKKLQRLRTRAERALAALERAEEAARDYGLDDQAGKIAEQKARWIEVLEKLKSIPETKRGALSFVAALAEHPWLRPFVPSTSQMEKLRSMKSGARDLALRAGSGTGGLVRQLFMIVGNVGLGAGMAKGGEWVARKAVHSKDVSGAIDSSDNGAGYTPLFLDR